ncbi:MAG: NirD/YgiW/YdeI family stress tolerance protein [Alphaproteobacteria bacterium]|nr:NirD/YgiW/YdeI family stress tolerance protein [Alphaproteobacteria bacterium]MBQ6011617.1 NirD/YgiW/YdeI family stress tolerance protein [Alphaproteobacteria bacterium]
MKKISVLALAAIMPICGAVAGPGKTMNNGTMNNAHPAVWTVTEVISLPDDTPVVMRGRITKNLGNDIFVFEDSSGTIMLEIDEESWNGNTVRVDDVVTVYGNVDKGSNYTEIDVESIVK